MAQPGSEGIKVVDAENNTAAPTSPSSSAINPNLVLNNALDGFANLSSKFNPFAQKLGKGFGQVRQYAQERLGTAEDITELPQEYKDLEKRVDALRSVHVNLLKVARTYNQPAYDYPVQIQETLVGLTGTMASQFQNLALSPAERAQTEQQVQQDEAKQHPKTLSHAISRVAGQGAEAIGVEEPLGTALFKLATINEKVGNARVKMDQDIIAKFNQPMQTTLATAIEQANKARRNVQSVRLSLDACKARYRSARPERSDAARLEVEQAEDQFVAAVEEATSLMKIALENPEPLRNLADFVHAQVNYYKEAQELLSELAPELDEIQVTQESIYRQSRE
ncbi:Bin/amphiphysin/Rvs domain for vesicular trafficking-domain-containing protein [Halteromyces radiatus]|uniref:Bin/amphiphysin/Rvs domain for vesicular trafficking-domain-containing protein n=1 Tax=Halteromyces radiatus TaxID=101107 RepID=UPI00221F9B89|nr:Bin/amphiphysin/Rvs domain for vesicular trafficking-domain-containing protein [Halteromyces radiatus]KAI8086538.1 Bin/amphiphysin/Rvs domain for vesicular trafficking-domain-containing protein [Halteromyces radiatus]